MNKRNFDVAIVSEKQSYPIGSLIAFLENVKKIWAGSVFDIDKKFTIKGCLNCILSVFIEIQCPRDP